MKLQCVDGPCLDAPAAFVQASSVLMAFEDAMQHADPAPAFFKVPFASADVQRAIEADDAHWTTLSCAKNVANVACFLGNDSLADLAACRLVGIVQEQVANTDDTDCSSALQMIRAVLDVPSDAAVISAANVDCWILSKRHAGGVARTFDPKRDAFLEKFFDHANFAVFYVCGRFPCLHAVASGQLLPGKKWHTQIENLHSTVTNGVLNLSAPCNDREDAAYQAWRGSFSAFKLYDVLFFFAKYGERSDAFFYMEACKNMYKFVFRFFKRTAIMGCLHILRTESQWVMVPDCMCTKALEYANQHDNADVAQMFAENGVLSKREFDSKHSNFSVKFSRDWEYSYEDRHGTILPEIVEKFVTNGFSRSEFEITWPSVWHEYDQVILSGALDTLHC